MNTFSNISIRKADTYPEKKQFLTFPWKIYKNDPLWVPPLFKEQEKITDPKRGVFFNHGTAAFFTAYKNRQLAGTICTGEDKITNTQKKVKDCIIGFFECINDYEVARALFDQAQKWAQNKNLTSLSGPYNLDYENGYGILIEGRDRPPAFFCGHTREYYQHFFKQYGFIPARGENIALAINLENLSLQFKKVAKLSERIRKKAWINIRSADFSRWEDEIKTLYVLLNSALTHLPDFIPVQYDSLKTMLEPFKNIADPECILFAEIRGKTVGCICGIPNLNEILIHINGLRYPWDYLKLLFYARKKPECLSIKSLLVLPEYWHSGVAIILFDEMRKRALKKGFKWVDLSLTSEDNPYTPGLAKRLGAKVYKRYQVYKLDISKYSRHRQG